MSKSALESLTDQYADSENEEEHSPDSASKVTNRTYVAKKYKKV